MVNIALIEDKDIIRLAQEKFLNSKEDINVVISASSTEAFQEDFINTDETIDLVISDIGLPGKSGIEATRWIKSKSPKTMVIIVSVYTDTDNIYKALCAGAVGYMVKNTPLTEIYDAIHIALSGGSMMTPSIARKVINHFAPVPRTAESELSEKEHLVVKCIVEGLSYKLIADRMGISINTVRHHIRSIYRKLQVNSKAEVIAKSYNNEL